MKTEEYTKKSEYLKRDEEYWKNYSQTNALNPGKKAIVVYHGIGNQLPVQTLDMFARNLVEAIEDYSKDKVQLCNMVYRSNSGEADDIYNSVRIKLSTENYIDIYEYYWAFQTEDKANIADIQKWISNVVSGAKEYYKVNSKLGEIYKDSSIFFGDNGKFRNVIYNTFLNLVFVILPLFLNTAQFALNLLSRIPVIGYFFTKSLEIFNTYFLNALQNVLGDITVYNVYDPKSKFYQVKKKILNQSLNFLSSVIKNDKYDKLIVAGHSLGSEIAYDTVNLISYLSQTTLKCSCGVPDSTCQKNICPLVEKLSGLCTFGSPLDKVAFLLQQKVKDNDYLWYQILYSYKCFRMNKLPFIPRILLTTEIKDDFLSGVVWRNYHDKNDYVSGSLDYYCGLTNVKCFFPKSFFTHSNYWNDKYFYLDFVKNFIK